MKHLLCSLPAACALLLVTADAANIPLTEARVERIVNDVKVVQPTKAPRVAHISDVIKDDIGVRTGQKSRCELRFQDETLTRLGAETIFSFKEGTREMTLGDGTMLLQVPKNHGGATIRTGAVSASVTGTTLMIEHLPNRSVKVLVLEGSVRVTMNGRADRVSITAGKMMVVEPQDKKLGHPVNVDLEKIIKTSVLIDPAKFSGNKQKQAAVLPSMPLIAKEIDAQASKIKNGTLVTTNLVIAGRGTELATTEKAGGQKDAEVAAADRPNSKRLSGDRGLATSQATAALVIEKATTASGSALPDRLNKAIAAATSTAGSGHVATSGGSGGGSISTGSGKGDGGGSNSGSGGVTTGTDSGSGGSSASGNSGSGSGNSGSGSSGSGSGSSGSGSGNSGSGSGNSGSGSGNSGSGSGNSGSGSNNSGSGSNNSGSGSNNSGSGSNNSGSGKNAVREIVKEVKKVLESTGSGKGKSGKG